MFQVRRSTDLTLIKSRSLGVIRTCGRFCVNQKGRRTTGNVMTIIFALGDGN